MGLRRWFWRGVVMAAGGVSIAAGLYPVAPQLALAVVRRARRRPQPDGLAGIVAAEWALSAALHALRPLGAFGIPLLGPQRRGPRPIVMLHGYAQGRGSFAVLAERLRRAGLGPLVGFEYWTMAKVERSAARLARLVARVRADTGAPRVDLVGHSMGGVVARAYVAWHGGGEVVRNLVTLGSPHRGTRAARFGVGWPSVELDRGSSLLRRLGEARLPEGVRALCLWSRADGLVSSRGDAHFPDAEEVVYDDLGHMGLLASRRVAREMVARLRAPR